MLGLSFACPRVTASKRVAGPTPGYPQIVWRGFEVCSPCDRRGTLVLNFRLLTCRAPSRLYSEAAAASTAALKGTNHCCHGILTLWCCFWSSVYSSSNGSTRFFAGSTSDADLSPQNAAAHHTGFPPTLHSNPPRTPTTVYVYVAGSQKISHVLEYYQGGEGRPSACCSYDLR